MKIRFYHWWIYKLYYKFWTPILVERPDMVIAMVDNMDAWLKQQQGVNDGMHH